MSAGRYKELREKHKRFIYEGCDVHTEKGVLYVSYRFEIEGLRKFVSKINIREDYIMSVSF